MEKSKGLPVFLKIILGIIITLVVLVVVAALFLGHEFKDEIASFKSLKEINSGDSADGRHVYRMDVKGNYYMDAFIERGGVKSTKDLMIFLTEQLSRGMYKPPAASLAAAGCSSFAAELEGGKRIFCRNYDMDFFTPIIILKTDPDDGRYASISTVDLGNLGVGGEGIKGMQEQVLALAGVYVPMDGMNEKGLAVSIHMSYQGPEESHIPTDINTGKLGVTSTSMLRLMLDKAANVDEAVEIAKSIDLHEDIGNSFHYMLADSSGKTAVIQWINGKDSTDTDGGNRELVVIYGSDRNSYIESQNYRIITNFITAEGYYEQGDKMVGTGRYEMLDRQLALTGGKLRDETEAMSLLNMVAWSKTESKEGFTIFSVVYNLSDKSALLAPYEDYDNPKAMIRYDLKD